MEAREEKKEERIPIGQVFFDNVFLLFLLSLVLSFIIYNLWGLLDLLRTPVLGP